MVDQDRVEKSPDNNISGGLPGLVRLLLKISQEEQRLLDEMAHSLESGDRSKVLKLAEKWAKQRHEMGNTAQNCAKISR